MNTTPFFIRRLPAPLLMLWTLALLLFCAGAAQAASLEKEFSTPPNTARPHVYWYWMNGHLSREGITADLEGMKRAGIGGVMIFNVGNSFPKGPVRCATPEWRAMVKHAVLEAGRLGIEVNLNNSPGGWSGSGGPWITPELAMQKLTWSETRLSGGKKIQLRLTRPPVTETYQPEFSEPPKPLGYYRDIAVLAFPTIPTEQPQKIVLRLTASDPAFKARDVTDGQKQISINLAAAPDRPAWIQFEAATPFPARTLHLDFQPGQSAQGGTLLASDDGAHWRTVRPFASRNGMPITVPFAAAPARFWKVTFEAPGAMTIGVSEAQLTPAWRIEDWTGKAVFDMFGLDKPLPPPASATAPADCVIPRERIVDLTKNLQPDGTLAWDAPAGDWTVIRFGYTPTGQITGTTAAYGAGGLEGDKFNPAALDVHWANALAPFLSDKEVSAHVQAIHQDSYELGAQNWSARFPEQFRTRRGYDIIPWLPVMTGRVVGSQDQSERFLWDLRRAICDSIADNYFGRLRDLCHKAGKQFTCEAYHEDQFDNVTVGALADVPMSEIWVNQTNPSIIPPPYWTKLGASPAHVYGHRIVQCESFTSNKWPGDGDWPMTPWGLKPLGDAIFCGGINRMVLHVSAMQPWMNVAPGMTIGYCGQQVHRGNTWWPLASGWTDYLARCQHLLRQGTFVADVLYSCGENSPSKSLQPEGSITSMPQGYDYDVCDPQAILTRLTVKDGRLVLPDGLSYRVLVLPAGDTMTPALLRKIGELAKAGATIMGPKPTRAPGLTGGPQADAETRKLADELWDGGRILPTQSLSPVLARLGAAPDFAPEASAPLIYIHRRLDDGRELYFVANHSTDTLAVRCKFRVAGRQPELWDPVSGKTRPLPEFTEEAGQTAVPLKFAPRQSFFVVFGKKPAQSATAKENFCALQPVAELAGPWKVSFDPKWGGPKEPVTFARLEDWTRRPEPGIRYYSGRAIYRKRFDLPKTVKRGTPLLLDLGVIKDMAAVRLNGRDLGVVWCAPWQVDISRAVKQNGNQLELTVVNTWANRMIGDEQLPLDYKRDWTGMVTELPEWLTQHKPRTSGRYTFATLAPFKRTDPLLPAGLLGPVSIQEPRAGK